MNNLIKILSLLVVFTLVSCTDLLEKPEPSTSTVQEVALGDASGVESLRANMYSHLFSFYYTTEYMIAPSTLADDLYTRLGANRFEDKANNSPGSTVAGSATGASAAGNVPADQYIQAYTLINQANLLIKAVGEDVISEDLLRQYRGEAYMLRAFAMHHLVRALGYEPGVTPDIGQGSGFDLGIIIRTDPILSADDVDYRDRNTVQEVYDQIESDLLQSIDLLSQGDADTPNYVTAEASKALLARVYLYWRKYDLADEYATAAINDSPARLATGDEVENLFEGTSVEDIFRAYVNNPSTEGSNSLASYTSLTFIAQVPTQDLMDSYEAGDHRLAWFGQCFDDQNSNPMPGCLATHPEISGGNVNLELSKWNNDIANQADHIPFFRVAEMVLIQAEARLKGSGGADEAIQKLNELRTSRGLNTYGGAETVEAVEEAILTSRRREFAGEGHRFFDLKRLGMDIPKAYDIPNVSDVPFSDRRILGIIPESEVRLSNSAVAIGLIPGESSLTQNPGY